MTIQDLTGKVTADILLNAARLKIFSLMFHPNLDQALQTNNLIWQTVLLCGMQTTLEQFTLWICMLPQAGVNPEVVL